MKRHTMDTLDRYLEILNAHAVDRAVSVFSEAFVQHTRLGDVAGVVGWQQLMRAFFHAFPDFEMIEDERLIAPGRAMLRFHWIGVHREPFLGLPPTHRMIRCEGMELFHEEDERFVESWNYADLLSVAAQMGADPRDAFALRLDGT
jgi:steroid delta-isomerase-like uncharacterized protein